MIISNITDGLGNQMFQYAAGLALAMKHGVALRLDTSSFAKNVIKIFQENLGWPNNTLMRFHFFLKNKISLQAMDFLFFCNANLLFVDRVDDEILPFEEGLIVLQHPGYLNKPRKKFAYEKNPMSCAHIPVNKGKHYVMGCFNGGTTETFFKMSEELSKNIDEDIKNGITAIWHDESHFNKYIIDKDIKILNPSYGYPEDWKLPFIPKIIIRDKTKYGGHKFLRGTKRESSVFKFIKSMLGIGKNL